MILFFKNIFTNFKNASITKKILSSLFIMLYLLILLTSIIKVDYSVMTPGTANRVDSVITVSTDNEVGQIYTVSIFEYRHVSLLNYIIARTSKDVATPIYNPDDEVPNKIDNLQGDIQKTISVNSAIVMAYEEASKDHDNVTIDYEIEGFYIYQLFENADKSMRIKDIITHIDGQKVASLDDILTYITGKNTVKMTVKRGKDILDLDIDLLNDGKLGISVYSEPLYNIKSVSPEYKIDDNAMNNSRGPSGGAMQALAIYNAITPTDITRGNKIMGTGTIDTLGNVGSIGGVEQKVIVADIYGSDIFFVPSIKNIKDPNIKDKLISNLDEAKIQYSKLENPKFKLVGVESFSDVITYLKGLGV
jgi:PDZ domain-containing protein